jgi:hypothetical protein
MLGAIIYSPFHPSSGEAGAYQRLYPANATTCYGTAAVGCRASNRTSRLCSFFAIHTGRKTSFLRSCMLIKSTGLDSVVRSLLIPGPMLHINDSEYYDYLYSVPADSIKTGISIVSVARPTLHQARRKVTAKFLSLFAELALEEPVQQCIQKLCNRFDTV